MAKTPKLGVPVAAFSFVGEAAAGEYDGIRFVEPAAPVAPVEPEGGGSSAFRRFAGDGAISLVKGAIAVPEAAVGLADLATGGRVGRFLENEDGLIGFRPKQAKAMLDEYLTPEQQAANRAVQEAEGFTGKLGAAVRNPSVVGHTILESVPAMGAGGVLARGALAVAPRMATYAAAGIGEGMVGAGLSAEQIRQETPDGLLTGKQSLIAGGSGAVTGALGIVAGKTAKKLGIGDIDTLIAGGAPNAASLQKSFVRKFLEGAVSEGALEELPQSVQEQMAQNYALGKPLDEGVDHAAVLGLLSGGAMGGIAGPLGSRGKVPEAGPLSRAANTGLGQVAQDFDAQQAPAVAPAVTAEQPLAAPVSDPIAEQQPVEPSPIPGAIDPDAALARIEAQGKDDLADLKQQGRMAAREEARKAAPIEVAVKPPEADDTNPEPEPGDVLHTKTGKPFTVKVAALNARKKLPDPEAFVVAKVAGGFVLRPIKTEVADGLEQPADAGGTGDARPADSGAGEPAGAVVHGQLPSTEAAGPAGEPVPSVEPGGDAARAEPEAGNDALTHEQDAQAGARPEPEAPAAQAPAAEAGDDAGAGRPANAGTAGVEAAGVEPIVEHVTGKGKTLRGVVRRTSEDEAKAIDPYAFKKDGGWFIREKHLGAATAEAAPESTPDAPRVVKLADEDVTLTPEQAAQWDEADKAANAERMAARQRAAQERNTAPTDPDVGYRNPKERLDAELKRIGMELSAKRRKIAGKETAKEQAKAAKDEAAFKSGDDVLVDGQPGKVLGTPFGKVRVQVGGETRMVARSSVEKAPAAPALTAAAAAPAPTPAPERTQVIDNGATNPGEFLVRGDGHNLARFVIGANGKASKVKHFFDSAQTRDMANAAIERFMAERASAEPAPAAPTTDKAEIRPYRRTDGSIGHEAVPIAAPEAAATKSDKDKALDDLNDALGDLAGIFGKNFRASMMPEQEQKLMPVLTRVMDAAFRAGYYAFKDAARFVLSTIRTRIGDEVADGITLDHLQGAYIGMAGKYKDRGATSKKDVVAVESLDELDASTTIGPTVEPEAPGADTASQEARDDATRELDRPSASALEGTPSGDARTPDAGGDAGAGTDGSSRADGQGDTGADGAGVLPARGLGGGARAVPVSGRGTRAGGGDGSKRRVRSRARPESEPGLFEDAGGTGGLNPAPNAAPIEPPAFKPQDFTIADDFALGEGGQKTKFRANADAIRLLKDLDASGRAATPTEQATLARYVGWGGLPQAFDGQNEGWAKEYAELKELLTPDEYADARQSTQYAHYTSREMIGGMYDALARLGFTGGRVLEPGSGVGNFMGLMPAAVRSSSRFTAVEREPIAAGIARHLYPQQNVQLADFTEFIGNDDYFDAAIGNPPFASTTLTDASGRKHLSGLSVHNYFFAKSVDMLREGGILAQVVSNSFLDAKRDTARRYIAERTTFLGAIRLPNNAFSKNANTEVTTDIVFLQKRPENEWGGKAAMEDAKRWLDLESVPDPRGGQDIPVNRYFADNPHMMLGTLGRYGTMYGPDQPALVARPGQDTAALMRAAIEQLPQGVYVAPAVAGTDRLTEQTVVALKSPTVQEGGYYVEGDKLFQRLPDVAGEARAREVTPATQWTEKTTLGEPGHARLVALSGMRRTLRDLLAAELGNDPAMEALRKTLNEQYDAYAKTHGLINDPSTLRVFDDDPDFPLLASLEHDYVPGMGPAAAKRQGIKAFKSTANKAPIFKQRVVDARQTVRRVETPADALAVSMAERGRIDAAYIGELLGRDAKAVLEELATGTKPLLFLDPASDEYVLRDAYLSGNVRAKLAQARQAGLFDNARELEKVQPEDVGAGEITARIGSPWVPEAVYEEFARDLLGDGTKATVKYIPLNSSYAVSITAGSETAATNTWGTKEYPSDALLSALLNNRDIKVTWRDQDGKTHVDQEATEAANVKAQDLRNRFQDWLFADGDRAEVLVRAYNDTNNNYVTRTYDGSWMTFPGKVPDSIIKFRRHQRNAIARIVQDRTSLLDHIVGAGKTFTVVSGAMELKRTGLAKKPLIAVPNHLVKQWAADFYRLYPGANILTATKKDFSKANRRKFLAKIATGDWDAVVMAHSSFGFIRPAPDFEARFNEAQIKHIVDTIEAVEAQDGDERAKKRTVKQLEGLKERLENRIKSLRQKPMDNLLDFEQIGVDQLFVDEAHLFKNLMFSTKMQNIRGLGDSKGSQRAYDMYVKVSQIYAKNGRGQGVVFATGTPVSNSLAEMYHMMRYLMPQAMQDMGFQSFDAWANTYASVNQEWDQKSSGDGFKAINTMSSFVNTHELLRVFDQVADTVTMEDIKAAFREENDGREFPLPKLKTGRRQPVSLVKSEAQNAYMQEIARRAAILEQRKGPPQKGEDNALVLMTDARKAAMDVRLVDATINEREKGGRIDRAAEAITERWKQYEGVRGTQLVFSDLGTPIKTVKAELKEYQELRTRAEVLQDANLVASAQLGNEEAIKRLEDGEEAQAAIDAKGGDWLGAIQAAMRGFSVYDDLRTALIERGIPETEIAFIHDFNTDEQKAALFRKVNAGQIRVLLGSTAKLGAGTNVQERLVALHHLDVPWKPSDIEQREGRIIRQGNRLEREVPDFEVEILAYVTQDTLDMKMWMIQERKLKMINQLRARKVEREIENSFEDMEMSAGEMQAAATGNMDLLREIQLRTDVKKLEQRKRAFDAQRNDLESRRRRATSQLGSLPEKIAGLRPWVKAAEALAEKRQQERPVDATIDGKHFTSREDAATALRALTDAHDERLRARTEKIAADDKLKAADVPMPKLAVEFNGKTYGSKAALAEAFTETVGDASRLDWDFDGKTFIRRSSLAGALSQTVADAIATDTEHAIGAVGPFKVSVEGQTDRVGGKRLDVMVEFEGRVVSSDLSVPKDGKDVAERTATAAVNVAERLALNARSELEYAEQQMAGAKKALAEIDKTEMAAEWPDAAKLEKARTEHRELLKRLSGTKKEDAAPADDAAPAEDLSIADNPDALNAMAAEFNRAYGPGRSLLDAPAGSADTLPDAPPNSEHAVLAKRLEQRLQARFPGTVLHAVDARVGARAGGASPGGDGRGRVGSSTPSRTLAAVATVAKRLFGHEVVFVRFDGDPLFNGIVSDAIPNTVFLRVDVGNPMMAVLGHELLHRLRASNPGVYNQLSNRLDRLIKNDEKFVRRLAAKYTPAAFKDVRVREELHADIVGDFFTDAEFWQAMAKDQPGLFRRVVNAILKFLDDVAAFIGSERPFGTDRYLTDIAAARDAVTDAMRQFSGAQVGAMTTQSEGINLSAGSDLSLSIADTLRTAATARGMSDLMADQFQSQKTFNGWWHRAVGTQYHKAQVSPEFKRVYDAAQDYLHDTSAFANEAANLAPHLLPQLDSLRDVLKPIAIREKDRAALARPIFQGTLTDEKVYSAEELRGDFGLNDDQARMYFEFRSAVNRSLDTLVAADVARFIGKGLPPALRAMVAEGDFGRFRGLVTAWAKQQSDDTLAELIAVRKANKQDAADLYKRHAKEIVAIKPGSRLSIEQRQADELAAMKARHEASERTADAAHDGAEQTRRTLKDKYEKVDTLKDKGYAPLMRFGRHSVYVTGPDGEQVFFGLYESQREANRAAREFRADSTNTVQQGVMSQEQYKLFAGMTPETVELFAELSGVEQSDAFQQYLKLAKASRSAMKRMIHRKGTAGFSEDVSRVLAAFITSNARAASGNLHLGDMADAITDIPKSKGDVIDEAVKLKEYVQNPQEEAQAIRGLLFTQFIGGSVASAMVNMTQPFTMTFPWLAQYGGAMKAGARIAAAIKQSLGKIDPDGELGRAIAKAEKAGIVSPQEVHQLQAEASRNMGNNPLVRKGLFVWGSLFSLAEQFNRRSTFIAAWNTAKAEGMADAFAFAAKAVDETQGVYNKGNKPNWARGALGGTIFTFKQFSISYMEFLKRLPPKERALALAVLIVAAGAQGLPGADDLDDLIDTIAQALGYDFNSKLAKTRFLTSVLGQGGADFVLEGFSALPGFPLDVSNRLSVGNLIPGTGMLLKSRTDKSREVTEVIGPAGSLAADALKAVGQASPRPVLPVALRNLDKALEMWMTGEYRDTKGRKVRDVSATDAAIKSVGFQPSEVAADSRRMSIAYQQVALARTVEAEIAGAWAQGIAEKDDAKVKAAIERLRTWNAKNPDSRISVNRAQVARRVREMRMSRDERFVKTAPRELRSTVLQ